MPTEIMMPALSPTMEDGTLARWLVAEGDVIASGDVIAEIETDKATMEFEAADDGTLGRILVPEGTAGVKVGTPIATLLAEGESADAGPEAGAPARADAGAEAAPNGVSEAPATPEPQSRPEPPRDADRAGSKPAAPASGSRIPASPLARRMAEEAGIPLASLQGTGPRGRIVKADVERAKERPAEAPATTSPAPAPQANPTQAGAAGASALAALYADRPYREVPLDGMRRTVAARLTEAKQTIPHFYLRREVRLDALMDLRTRINAGLAPRGIKLSVNDFVVKAAATALRQVPEANAIWAGDRILRFDVVDIAVAVAVEGGLFTPVLHDAGNRSLSDLSTAMKDLAGRARDRKLAPQDYQGGSFAISNLGMYGVESFDAVINPPHSAILAVGAGTRRPVVMDDGQIAAATVMSLTLSVDHRAIDGALAAELLGAIVEALENPLPMLV